MPEENPPAAEALDAPHTTAACLYRRMLLSRTLSLALAHYSPPIRGFCHLSAGQEALPAALQTLLESHPRDSLAASYRCHAFALAAGESLSTIVAECLGKRSGSSRGRGGSMHVYNSRFYGGHGIVGAQVPIAAGVAFANKYRSLLEAADPPTAAPAMTDADSQGFENPDSVVYAVFGDGAFNQGQVHETFNLARTLGLRILFICENNGLAMTTPATQASPDDCFYHNARSMPGLRASDSDPLRLLQLLQGLRACVLASGPMILQIDCTRLLGHSLKDFEEASAKETPLETLKARLLKSCPFLVREAEEGAVKAVQEAVEAAEREEEPSDLYRYLY